MECCGEKANDARLPKKILNCLGSWRAVIPATGKDAINFVSKRIKRRWRIALQSYVLAGTFFAGFHICSGRKVG
jgi:hypothetical protein